MLEIDQNDELFVGDEILKEFGKCTDCGLCCSFFDSLILYPEEISQISDILSFDESVFMRKFTKIDKENNRSLVSPCPFLDQKKCMIHHYRFFVCRAFPLCINLSKNQGVLSGIYVCPQATQFYEGLLQFYKDTDEKSYRKLIDIENKTDIDDQGMKICGKASLFGLYLDWLTANQK